VRLGIGQRHSSNCRWIDTSHRWQVGAAPPHLRSDGRRRTMYGKVSVILIAGLLQAGEYGEISWNQGDAAFDVRDLAIQT
jgi:hypothetical protein